MPNRRRPDLLADHHTEIVLGVAFWLLGIWLIYDAYEGRGRSRPFGARLLP